MNKKLIGFTGEQIACKFLLEKWLQFIEHSFQTKFWEIDLIFKDKDQLIFIEVKTRNNNVYWEWFESVNEKKINKMIKTWEIYCKNNNTNFNNCRFDVISILLNWKTCKIKHFVKIA